MSDWDNDDALVELTAKVAEMEDKMDKKEAEMDEKDKEQEMAKKKAMEDKEHEKKEANKLRGQHDEKDKEMEAAIMSAMDEEDKDKRVAAVKKAMDDHKKDHEGMDDDKDKKMTEQQATIEQLTKIAAEPKITYLASVYKQVGTPENKMVELKAAWDGMSLGNLDTEIARIQPFVGTASVPSKISSPTPVGSIPSLTVSASVDPALSKLDKSSGADIFNGGVK